MKRISSWLINFVYRVGGLSEEDFKLTNKGGNL